MTATDAYRQTLRSLPRSDWEAYLLAHSGLPGPRGNLELAAAVADEATDAQLAGWRLLTPEEAPVNAPAEFLAFCGVLGFGRRLATNDRRALAELRPFAADPRWRTREAVAMALQRWGDADMDALLIAMWEWAQGDAWEQRAVAAGLCEPRLLREAEHAIAVLGLLDDITAQLAAAPLAARKSDAFKTLRQALGYCWSVAVVANPETGKPLMEKWLASADPDVRWVMRENLKKNRLRKLDAAWCEHQLPHD